MAREPRDTQTTRTAERRESVSKRSRIARSPTRTAPSVFFGRGRRSRTRRRCAAPPPAVCPGRIRRERIDLVDTRHVLQSVDHALARARAASTRRLPDPLSRIDAAAMRAACSLRAVAGPSRCAAVVPLVATPTPRRLHSTPRRRKTVRARAGLRSARLTSSAEGRSAA